MHLRALQTESSVVSDFFVYQTLNLQEPFL